MTTYYAECSILAYHDLSFLITTNLRGVECALYELSEDYKIQHFDVVKWRVRTEITVYLWDANQYLPAVDVIRDCVAVENMLIGECPGLRVRI